mgnify:CR=1 FL=1
MNQFPDTGTLAEFQNRLAEYLPTLAAGLIVVALGLGVGWLTKRAIIRALVWLRLDRLGGRQSWRAAFAKGDVRSALYDKVGNVAMILVMLVFLDNALQIWQLDVLSRLVDRFLVYLPTLALVLVIAGLGLLVANTIADRVENALEEEGMARARLVAKTCKAALWTVVGALALWELNFAREIVLAAFLIGFGAVGVAFALSVGIGSSRAVQRMLETMMDKGSKDR